MRLSSSVQKSKRPALSAVSQGKKRSTAKAHKTCGGVVMFCVQGLNGSIESKIYSPSKLVEMLQEGLPFGELEDLQASLAIPCLQDAWRVTDPRIAPAVRLLPGSRSVLRSANSPLVPFASQLRAAPLPADPRSQPPCSRLARAPCAPLTHSPVAPSTAGRARRCRSRLSRAHAPGSARSAPAPRCRR